MTNQLFSQGDTSKALIFFLVVKLPKFVSLKFKILLMRIYIILLYVLFLSSCSQKNNNEDINISENINIQNKYAFGFSVSYNEMYKTVCVKNPWQGASNVKLEYFLLDRDKKIPESLKDKNIIRIPVKRIVCLSTTHAAMIEFIDEENTIVGVAGKDYLVSTKIRKLITEGKIKDIGYDNNLNYELLIGLKPDVVMIYGVGSEANQIAAKLHDLKIPSVLNAEYLEENILAKTEWIKFMAAFYNKENLAENKFLKIENEYLALKNQVAKLNKKPKVLTGLPWKGIWWIPGGRSHMAQLISDAGGDYLWKKNSSKESFPQSIELVFEKAHDANVWINSGAANNRNEILNVDERIKNLKIFQNGYIYNNNARLNNSGGNDFWESGVVSPQLILKDLIYIFHPELFPGYELKYYKKI